jgi:hypothetical protein
MLAFYTFGTSSYGRKSVHFRGARENLALATTGGMGGGAPHIVKGQFMVSLESFKRIFPIGPSYVVFLF